MSESSSSLPPESKRQKTSEALPADAPRHHLFQQLVAADFHWLVQHKQMDESVSQSVLAR